MKPCPFCAAPDPRQYLEERRGVLFAVVQCSSCFASHGCAVHGHIGDRILYSATVATFAQLCERWNCRTPPMEPPQDKRKGKRKEN